MVQAPAPPFAELLRRHRQAAGLTQEELAERAGLSVRGIKALEGGERTRPHRDTVQLLVDALQLAGEQRSAFEAAARTVLPADAPVTRPSEPLGDFLGARPTGPLVARGEEWGHLLLVFDAVEHGSGRLVLLPGEVGVGKTRLAQEADRQARDRGFLAAVGRCYREDTTRPLAPVSEALTTLSTQLSASRWREFLSRSPAVEQLVLADRLPAEQVGQDEYQHIRAVADLLRSAAQDRPLALLLDDLQWADAGTVTLIQHLARTTRAQPVLLLGTYRENEVTGESLLGRAVRDLMREGLVERIPVRRLTPEGTAALVESAIGGLDEAEGFVEFVHRRSKGIPFFIRRMVLALGGRYRLVRQIGVGGMGRVFEAVDTENGRTVAAKIMFGRTESDVHARLRFEQEGAILATLDHPNIVQVFGTFLEEHASCIVMELLEGQSLGQLIGEEEETGVEERPDASPSTRKGMPLPRVQRLTTQVLLALGYAHERGIVHRDIKPDNVMVLPQDQVKVTDFGIARLLRPIDALTTMTSTGLTMGTPLYMAPEQVRGEKVDGRADLYAVGAVLYELVTGRPPFEGHDPLTVAIKHLEQAPPPPSTLSPEVPKEWDGVILKALAKDPAQRFQSATEMEDAVRALPTDVSPARKWGGLRATARHRGRRLQQVALATAAAVILGLIAIAGSYFLFSPAHTPATSHTVASLGSPQPWGRPGLLTNPQSVAVDGRGDVFVVTGSFSDHIEEFAPSGRLLSNWGPTFSRPGGPKLQVSIGSIAADGQGHVYAADRLSNHLLELSSRGQLLANRGFKILAIAGLAVDEQGNVYVGDNGERILKLSGSGKVLARWRTSPFSNSRLALDGQGNVYVVYTGENFVQKYSPAGKLVFQWGGSGGQLADTADVAADRQGNVYVVDDANNYMVEYSSGGHLRAVKGYEGSLPGQFSNPSGVAVDGQGNVYMADTGNSRLQKLARSG